MSNGGTHTTPAGPPRCAYCGHRCHGRTCRWCEDLGSAAVNSEAPDRLATCPKCGDLAEPGRETCAACGTRLYPRVAK